MVLLEVREMGEPLFGNVPTAFEIFCWLYTGACFPISLWLIQTGASFGGWFLLVANLFSCFMHVRFAVLDDQARKLREES